MSKKYLGKSFKYPFQPNDNDNIAKVEGLEAIKQSFYSILTTPIGTRFYLEDYGSNLHKLTHLPNDSVLESLLRFHIPQALDRWEKRANIVDVMFEDVKENQKNCLIVFIDKKTNLQDTFVYPFYSEINR